MPIDHKGTKPGVSPAKETPEPVHMKCKNCDSMLAVELKIPGQKGRMYQCVECKATRGILVGGSVDL